MQALLVVFLSVFVAELGDKTQVATLLFATDQNLSRAGVFAASSAALVCTSLLAVLFGGQIARFVSPTALKMVAGAGFIAISIWMLIDAHA
jgi:putative Ca2+/H+ antiporter (TMEM165/GDT1 family)